MRLTAMAVAWLVGLALAYLGVAAAPIAALLLAAAMLSFSLLCRLAGVSPWPAFLVAICLLGVWRYEVAEPEPRTVLTKESAPALLRGRIANDPESTATRIKFTLELSARANGVKSPEEDWRPGAGRILVYAHPPAGFVSIRGRPYFQYGDLVELSGTLQRPQPVEGFDYPAYLESKGIHAVFWAQKAGTIDMTQGAQGNNVDSGASMSWRGVPTQAQAGIYGLRRQLSRALESSLPPSEAALARALLLGLRGQLSEDVKTDFRESGTAHLLAISGLHLGIMLLLALGALQWALGRHTPAPLVLAFLLIWLYVLLSGAPASVVRAAIMGSAYLAALGFGRPRESLLPALALSVVAMTVANPVVVTQISFQLSFAAMAAIVVVLPWQEAAARATGRRMEQLGGAWAAAGGTALGWVTSGVIVSAAATVATFPLVALHFNQLPLLGIPATILATPLLPFALVGGLVAALAGSVHPLVGQFVGLPASIPLTALLQFIEVVPKETLTVNWGHSGGAWAWYGILLASLVAASSRPYRQRVLAPLTRMAHQSEPGSPGSAKFVGLGLAGITLATTAVFLVIPVLDRGDGLLHVYFLDVGQGDSILIVTPNGKQALVDGGPEYGGAARYLAEILPPWDRSLDLVAATHLDADHSRGLLKVLENYRVGTVFSGPPDGDSSLYPQWKRALEAGRHRTATLAGGQSIELEEGILLKVLHPPVTPLRGPAWESNNNSLVLQLVYGDISFLLTGDIEEEAERYLVRNLDLLESDVLKAAHHGSKSSTTGAFLNAVNPQWAVISAGLDNQYGHPHPSVTRRLIAAVGERGLFSTAEQGTINFRTDGQRLWVETER